MVKCEVIEKFTLKDFDKLKNIQRKSVDLKGGLFVGDTFECDEEMAKYLTGGNTQKKVVVKVIEVIPKTKDISPKDTKEESEKIISLDEENLKEIAKQVNKAVKKSKKSKK